jgi:hypothetical protein
VSSGLLSHNSLFFAVFDPPETGIVDASLYWM